MTVAAGARAGEVTQRAQDPVRFARSQGYQLHELVEIMRRT